MCSKVKNTPISFSNLCDELIESTSCSGELRGECRTTLNPFPTDFRVCRVMVILVRAHRHLNSLIGTLVTMVPTYHTLLKIRKPLIIWFITNIRNTEEAV